MLWVVGMMMTDDRSFPFRRVDAEEEHRRLRRCYRWTLSLRAIPPGYRVLADVCIVPLGVGTSVSKYVSEVEKVLRNYPGVSTTLHGYGTNIEGQWSDVIGAVKLAHEVLHEMGCPRVNSNMRFGTRIDKHQTLKDKVDKVENIIAAGSEKEGEKA
ncbi:hypothetical protein FOZ63_030380 [Perkinsus olseni]|uniref:Thiamine-binding protein domain-containing protein n=1 Tax=Perkinsus olseni TaxID=32597 RepID=A0A7J6R230_PEROL|nr:hypothetical protein FOZ63_030380 [Perkinsus olseni]